MYTRSICTRSKCKFKCFIKDDTFYVYTLERETNDAFWIHGVVTVGVRRVSSTIRGISSFRPFFMFYQISSAKVQLQFISKHIVLYFIPYFFAAIAQNLNSPLFYKLRYFKIKFELLIFTINYILCALHKV